MIKWSLVSNLPTKTSVCDFPSRSEVKLNEGGGGGREDGEGGEAVEKGVSAIGGEEGRVKECWRNCCLARPSVTWCYVGKVRRGNLFFCHLFFRLSLFVLSVLPLLSFFFLSVRRVFSLFSFIMLSLCAG